MNALAPFTRRTGFRHLFSHACKVWGMSQAHVMSRSKRREVSWARQSLAWWLVTEHKFGVAEVGRLLQKDHTTIVHGIGRVNAVRGTEDPRWAMVSDLLDNPAPPVPSEMGGHYLIPLTVAVAFSHAEPETVEPYSFVTYQPPAAAPVPPPVIRRPPRVLATPIRIAA